MAKKVKTEEESAQQTPSKSKKDDLASILHDSLNKQFKDCKVAYFLDSEEENPADIIGWISTGSSMLDLAISNRPNGGFPVGRIIENTGLEAGGKSLLAAHALASTQKQGGLAILIDTENSISEQFMEAIGVDNSKLLYIQLETIEDIFEAIENIIIRVRESDKKRLVTIVVDSISGASTKGEIDGDYDKDGYATCKAILLSKAMRKITNMIGKERICLILNSQLRSKLGVMFGDPWCVDPHTTCVTIKHKVGKKMKIEEMSLAEFSDRFVNNDDFDNPEEFDIEPEQNIQILSEDENGKECYRPILGFVVKETVDSYFTDGKLKGTSAHIIIEDGKEIFLKDHPDFKRVKGKMQVVDIEVADTHTYKANGRLNHNTTSGGKAIAFHASVRLRLKAIGQIKAKKNGIEQVIGIKTQAQVIKNRVGPPLKKVEFDIHFNSGIDDYGSWLTVMKDYNLIKKSGSNYIWSHPDTKEEYKFTANEFETIDADVRQLMYDSICDIMISKYKKDVTIDDIEISDEPVPEG